MTFGRRLARLRNSRSLTQTQLADILNAGKSTIAMYEKDKRQPSLEVLMSIADYFDVTVDYLLKGDQILEASDFGIEEKREPTKLNILLTEDSKEEDSKEEDLTDEIKDFIDRYNKLGELEQKYLMAKIDDITKFLLKM
ncbi:transcriptional regulator [Bacillus sp. AFS001701]|uniref:helix-turn-helix domain-containing protein n=1 Tax=Bacillus sp. AFS001701 TaxID=2033480 RepID=UPI000BF42723|nr:helix-turn-helix domain-containing protein [Bacillus sp. AFS001701]PET77570.1 transcriptional regulator [Bacillus sp. AFS001701]